MAGTEISGGGLVVARFNENKGAFLRETGWFDRAENPEGIPDGAIAGPVLLAERGIGGTSPLIRRHLVRFAGQSALVIVEHQIDGRGSGVNAQGLCEAAARAEADAILIRPESTNAAEGHIRTMQAVDENVAIIVGPPRAWGYSAASKPEGGIEDITWNETFLGPIDWGVHNFYMPGGEDGTISDDDIERIGRWSELFQAEQGLGAYTLWLDGVHATEGGMARVLQTVGSNINVIVSKFGNEPLPHYVADVRNELAAHIGTE